MVDVVGYGANFYVLIGCYIAVNGSNKEGNKFRGAFLYIFNNKKAY